MVAQRADLPVSEIPIYKIDRLKQAYYNTTSMGHINNIGYSMGLSKKEIDDIIAVKFTKARKPIKTSTEDFKREVPVEDRCPTKIWQEWDKTLTLSQVKRGVWKDNHVIGNVICEF